MPAGERGGGDVRSEALSSLATRLLSPASKPTLIVSIEDAYVGGRTGSRSSTFRQTHDAHPYPWAVIINAKRSEHLFLDPDSEIALKPHTQVRTAFNCTVAW